MGITAVTANESRTGKDLAAIADGQTVAKVIVVTDMEIAAIVPDGAGAGDEDGIAVGASPIADRAGGVDYCTAAGND